jgi:hypothetical protein
MRFWASDRLTPAAKYLYRSIFLDDDILHFLLRVISFYDTTTLHGWQRGKRSRKSFSGGV